MKKELVFGTAISFILFLIVVLFYVHNKSLKKNIENCVMLINNQKKLIESKEDLIVTFAASVEIAHKTNGEKINPLIEVRTENNDITTLKELIGVKKKLVFRYSEIHCQVCIDKEIALIIELVKEIGKENIIILTYYNSFRNMTIFKRMNQLDLPMLNIRDLELELEEKNVPYYFVIDNSMVMQNVMIPNKYHPEISKSYLEYVKRIFSLN